MTSGKSCIKWMKEAGRGHLVAVLSWGSYALLLSSILLRLQFDLLGTFLGMGRNTALFMLCVGLGISIGCLEFSYLLQARKQDFYFSLPVKKSTIFLGRYLHGFLHGLLPMICYMLLCGIYQSSIDSLFMGYSVGYTFRSMLVYGMVFLLFYHITIFAICSCGQIVAVLCMLVLILYGFQFFLEQVCLGFVKQFYETFYRSPVLEMLEKTLVPWQLGRSLTGQEMYEKFQILETQPEMMQLAAGLIWIAVFGGLAVFAHKCRKAESVGRIFTIKAAENGTEAVLTVLAGTGLCSLLLSVTGIGEMSRLSAGVLLSVAGIVATGIVHFFYERFIRGRSVRNTAAVFLKNDRNRESAPLPRFVKYNLYVILECAVVLAVVCVLIGGANIYDTYLPENDEVESVQLALKGLDMDMDDYHGMQNHPDDYQTNYRLEQYVLSEEGKEAGMDWIRGLCEEDEYTKVTVCFRKKNGREVYRTYPVSESMFLAFADVYETEEYKQAAYPLITQGEETVEGTRFVWDDGVSEQTLKLAEEEKKEFFKSYKSDIEVLNMIDLQTALPVGSLSVESEVYNRSTSVMIYPFFEKCTAFLEEHGVNLEKQVTDYPVQSVTVWEKRSMSSGKTGGATMQRYEAEEEIAEWKGRLIPQKFCVQPLLYPVDMTEEIEVEVIEPESGAVIMVECGKQ